SPRSSSRGSSRSPRAAARRSGSPSREPRSPRSRRVRSGSSSPRSRPCRCVPAAAGPARSGPPPSSGWRPRSPAPGTGRRSGAGHAFGDVVAREQWLRLVDPGDAAVGHAHGPGYLVPLGLVGFLPWTPLLPLVLAPLFERERRPGVALAGGWIASGFVFFSIAAAKRSVYLLPLHPALALLAGAADPAPPPRGRPRRAARAGAARPPAPPRRPPAAQGPAARRG